MTTIKIQRETLLALTGAVGPWARRGILLPTKHVRLTTGGGRLSALATDLETVARASAPFEGEAVDVLVPLRVLASLAQAQGEEVTLSQGAADTTISVGGLRLRWKPPPLDEYPVAEIPDAELRRVEGLGQALRACVVAASRDERRFNLNVVHLTGKEAVATDGHRMHVVPCASPVENVMLPVAFAEVLAGVGNVELGMKGEKVVARAPLEGGHLELSTRPVDGQFPGWKQVMSVDRRMAVRVEAEALARELRALMAAVERGENACAAIELASTYLAIDLNGNSEGHVVVPCEAEEGVSARVGCNLHYLLDAVRVCGGTAELGADDDVTPILIHGPEGFRAVIMPVRL